MIIHHFFVINIVQSNNSESNDIAVYGRFSNGADLQVNISLKTEQSDVNFANTTFQLAPYSLKYSLQITNWPFATIRNQLGIIIQSTGGNSTSASSSTCGGSTSVENSAGNLLYFLVKSGDQYLYGQMVPIIIIDGTFRNVSSVFLKETDDVMITIPHFWDQIVVDPNYSVLVGENVNTLNPCEKSNQLVTGGSSINKSVIIGVVVGVVGGVILLAVFVFVVLPKIQLWRVMVKNNENDHIEFPVELSHVNREYVSSVKTSSAYTGSKNNM